MIPKIIHYCWFGGNPKPNDVVKYISSWKKYCPDYEIKEWNESNFDLNENEYCREAYEAKKWAFVTDYVRLKALYEEGGFYMDTDVEVVKPLEPLRIFNAVSGYESKHHISTGTMGACRHNEWIGMLLKDYEGRHFIRENGVYDTTTNVVAITNLTVNNYGLNLQGQRIIFGDNMAILPFDFLCAKSWETGKVIRTENTYTIHHFKGSWLSPEDQYCNALRTKCLQIMPGILAMHVASYCATVKYHGFGAAMGRVIRRIYHHGNK